MTDDALEGTLAAIRAALVRIPSDHGQRADLFLTVVSTAEAAAKQGTTPMVARELLHGLIAAFEGAAASAERMRPAIGGLAESLGSSDLAAYCDRITEFVDETHHACEVLRHEVAKLPDDEVQRWLRKMLDGLDDAKGGG